MLLPMWCPKTTRPSAIQVVFQSMRFALSEAILKMKPGVEGITATLFLMFYLHGFGVLSCDLPRDVKENCFPLFPPEMQLSLPQNASLHYQELLLESENLRGLPIHSYANYHGPWIENHWIDYFCCDRPLTQFGPYIPLFIQWTDISVINLGKKRLVQAFLKKLKSDVPYITITQHDDGLEMFGELPPNLLQLSAGGVGSAAIPLIMGELTALDTKTIQKTGNWTFDVSFLGSIRSIRAELMDVTKSYSTKPSLRSFFGKTLTWREIMKTTKFQLCPRGYGRTSFRLAEVIQLGLIPIYVYDDFEWAPYSDWANVQDFGFSVQMDNYLHLLDSVAKLNLTDIQRRFAGVARARKLYTYRGVLDQVALFLNSSCKGINQSLIRCLSYHKNH
eukprot:g42455.t1